MNSTTSEHRGRLRARAAVVADFDVSDLVTADDDVDEVFDFLDEDCDQLETSDGTLRWAVKDVRRQETLASVPLAELRRLREQATISEVTQVQEMLDRSLRSGWTDEEVDTLPLADARAASVVAQWWDGARDDVPTARRIRDQIDRLALFGDVRAMADNHFVGRAAESARLRRSFERDTAPVLLHGPGGMGKSALVARHIVWALDEAGAKVALLDFDDPTLDPFNPAKLAERVIDVVTRQLDATDRNVVELRAQAADAAMSANYASASQGRRGATIGADWEYLIKDLLSVVGHDVPILVVLDTFEQVQRQGPSAVYAVAQLVDGLRRLPRMRIVVSGRRDPPVEIPGSSLQLGGLAEDEALDLLTQLAPVPVAEEMARAVVTQVGTAPLTIRLAARVLADMHDTEDLTVLSIKADQIDAVLYRRILSHIPDTEVRRLAHPGLVLRRITPDIIREVLAGPCGVDVADMRGAADLHERLAHEVMLVDRDGDALVHRSDVRQMMLSQLLLDRPVEVRRIQEAAVRYYAARDGLQDRVEELYHRLMLREPAKNLTERWDSRAARQLAMARDELPDASRRFLLTRMSDEYLSDEDRRMVTDAQWMDKAEPQVLRLLDTAQIAEALRLIWERTGPDDESMFPDLEIEALEAGFLFAHATEVARAHRRSAAGRADTADVVTYSLHLVRLLERMNRADEARAVLDETMALITGPTVDRLRLLVAWLGVHRRGDDDDSAARADSVRESLDLYGRISPVEIQQVRGLLRDLAAEVGAKSTGIVQAALRTVGVSAHAAELIPAALREMAEDLAGPHGASPEELAQLVRVGRSESGIRWTDIQDRNRDAAGRSLAEALDIFAESGQVLCAAVAREYQSEADAAYFADSPTAKPARDGLPEDVAHKRIATRLATNPDAAIRTRAIEAVVAEGDRLLRLGQPGTAKVRFQLAAYSFAQDTDPNIKETVNALRRMIVDLGRKRPGNVSAPPPKKSDIPSAPK